MTQPVSFFRRVTLVLELYRRKWQGGNIYWDQTNTIIWHMVEFESSFTDCLQKSTYLLRFLNYYLLKKPLNWTQLKAIHETTFRCNYGKQGGTLVCHLLQDLKVPVQALLKTKTLLNNKCCSISLIQNIKHIVCVCS